MPESVDFFSLENSSDDSYSRRESSSESSSSDDSSSVFKQIEHNIPESSCLPLNCFIAKSESKTFSLNYVTVRYFRRGIRAIFDTYVLLCPLFVSFCWPLWWILYSANCISPETNGSITFFFWRTLRRRIRTVIRTDAGVSRFFLAGKYFRIIRWFVQS